MDILVPSTFAIACQVALNLLEFSVMLAGTGDAEPSFPQFMYPWMYAFDPWE